MTQQQKNAEMWAAIVAAGGLDAWIRAGGPEKLYEKHSQIPTEPFQDPYVALVNTKHR